MRRNDEAENRGNVVICIHCGGKGRGGSMGSWRWGAMVVVGFRGGGEVMVRGFGFVEVMVWVHDGCEVVVSVGGGVLDKWWQLDQSIEKLGHTGFI